MEPGGIDVPPRRTAYALDLMAFSLADVRDGLGPYLSIYLLLTHHWDQASIGFVMAVGGIAGVVAQTPVGALVDRTTAKRALVIVGAVAVAAAALAMPLLRGLAYFLGPVVVFWLLAAMAVISVMATLRVPNDAIDNDAARGLDKATGQQHRQLSGFAALLHNRSLMIFAVLVFIFHFANAAVLPLVGQQLALHNKEVGTALMSACIVAAQVVMVPVAYIVGTKADTWGRKPIFLVGFAVLTVRAFLYPLWDNSYWLVGVQLLDGVGAGIFGALFPLVVQDVTHGTGRFKRQPGSDNHRVGIGAALSNFVAGGIVVAAGYGVAFMSLGAIAAVGFVLYLNAMPETVPTAGGVAESV